MSDLLVAIASDFFSIVAGVLIGFACGSIPFGYLLVKMRRGEDVRATGSGNIGATNVSRALGTSGGALTLVLDAAKGAAGVLAAVWAGSLGADVSSAALPWAGALGAVLGHCYTPWLGFRGGKGVATLIGAFGVAAPGPMGVSVVVLLSILAASRMMSLASLGGTVALPLALWWWARPAYPEFAVAAAVVAAGVIFWRHRSNIARLLDGQERRLGKESP